MRKCLVVFKEENYVLFLNDHKNKVNHLIDAIKKKKGLYNMISNDHDFLIYDKDFDTYVHLDDEIEIDNLSKILIRPKSIDNFSNSNHKLTSKNLKKANPAANSLGNSSGNSLNNQQSHQLNSSLSNQLTHPNTFDDNSQTNESIVIAVNPNDLNNSNNQSSILNLDANTETTSEPNHSNCSNNQITKDNLNSIQLLNKIDNELEASSFLNDENDQSNEFQNKEPIEWTDNEIYYLMECCKEYPQEFAYYNKEVDLALLNLDDSKLWEQIAIRFKSLTNRSLSPQQCKSKFIKIRTTYLNIIAYSPVEQTYFGQLKYFNALNYLINGLKPSPEILKLKSRLREKIKERGSRDKNISSSHLALIQQVKAYSKQFSGEKAKTYIWKDISDNLNAQGYTFTGKSCQGLFHRLRYNYLHLVKTISSEEQGMQKWPYFSYFSELDLTPFTGKRQEIKRKPRKTENSINKNGDETVDEEFEDESNGIDEEHEYEISDDDHLDPAFSFGNRNTQLFTTKRLKTN